MSHLLDPGMAANGIHHVVRCRPARLVNEDRAIQRREFLHHVLVWFWRPGGADRFAFYPRAASPPERFAPWTWFLNQDRALTGAAKILRCALSAPCSAQHCLSLIVMSVRVPRQFEPRLFAQVVH